MSAQEPYESWKRQRRLLEVSTDFADRVMQRIYAADGHQRPGLPTAFRILEWIGKRVSAQAAAILLATALTLAEGAFLLRIGIG